MEPVGLSAKLGVHPPLPSSPVTGEDAGASTRRSPAGGKALPRAPVHRSRAQHATPSPQPPPTAAVANWKSEHALLQLLKSDGLAARWLRRAVVMLLVGVGVASVIRAAQSLTPEYVYMKDFVQDYLWVRAVVEGTDPYRDVTELAQRYFGYVPTGVFPHPNAHPPTTGLLMLPLAWVDYATAATVWFALEAGIVLLALYLLCRGSGVRRALPAGLAAGIAIFAWYPFHKELALGQLSALVLLLLAGAWVALRANRKGLGGALLGVAVLIKPVPWPLLLVLLVRREWRALGGAVLTMAAGGLVTLAALGIERMMTYQSGLQAVGQLHRAEAQNMSLWTVGWRVFHGTQSTILTAISAPPLLDFEPAVRMVSVGLPVLVLGLAAFAAARHPRLDLALGMMLAVSLLLSPIAWDHYLVLAAFPIALLVGRAARGELGRQTVSLALLTAVPLLFPVRAWMDLAVLLAGAAPGSWAVSFWPALLTYVPSLGVAALAVLLSPWVGREGSAVRLGSHTTAPPPALTLPRKGGGDYLPLGGLTGKGEGETDAASGARVRPE